jgi:TRAP-type C4-dicarboxylate transport system permease small subunit
MMADTKSATCRVGRLAKWLDGLLGLFAATLLFAMMALTFVDVLGRYLLSSPVPGAFELTEVAMGLLIFAGLPLISARDGHVAVNIADEMLPARVLRLRALVLDLLICACTAILAWTLWDKGLQLSKYGDATAYLGLKLGPVLHSMATLSALTAAALLSKAWFSWRAFRDGGGERP